MKTHNRETPPHKNSKKQSEIQGIHNASHLERSFSFWNSLESHRAALGLFLPALGIAFLTLLLTALSDKVAYRGFIYFGSLSLLVAGILGFILDTIGLIRCYRPFPWRSCVCILIIATGFGLSLVPLISIWIAFGSQKGLLALGFNALPLLPLFLYLFDYVNDRDAQAEEDTHLESWLEDEEGANELAPANAPLPEQFIILSGAKYHILRYFFYILTFCFFSYLLGLCINAESILWGIITFFMWLGTLLIIALNTMTSIILIIDKEGVRDGGKKQIAWDKITKLTLKSNQKMTFFVNTINKDTQETEETEGLQVDAQFAQYKRKDIVLALRRYYRQSKGLE